MYGLPVVEKRRKPYAKINPTVAREVFIREALVEGKYKGKGEFFTHNVKLVKSVLDYEAKSRKRDVLVDDQLIYDFYNALALMLRPPGLLSLKSGEKSKSGRIKSYCS